MPKLQHTFWQPLVTPIFGSYPTPHIQIFVIQLEVLKHYYYYCYHYTFIGFVRIVYVMYRYKILEYIL